jgi:hypothetical protein
VRAQTEASKRFRAGVAGGGPAAPRAAGPLFDRPWERGSGEDIGDLPRAESERLRLPAFDFWLFDSKILARFAFDEDGNTLGGYVTETLPRFSRRVRSTV